MEVVIAKYLKSFELTIKPVKAEFVNVPNPHVKQYLFIEMNPSIPGHSMVHHMSIICSGDIPLSVEAFSDSTEQLKAKSQTTVNATMVFASGEAAKNLFAGRNHSTANQTTFDFFQSLYKQITK